MGGEKGVQIQIIQTLGHRQPVCVTVHFHLCASVQFALKMAHRRRFLHEPIEMDGWAAD